jgi:signal transduction histidine kinase
MFSKLKQIFRNRLTRNAFFFYFGSLIAVVGLLLVFIYFFLVRSLNENLKQLVILEQKELVSSFQKEGLAGLKNAHEQVYVRVLDQSGKLVYEEVPKEEGIYHLQELDHPVLKTSEKSWFRLLKMDDEDVLIGFSEKISPEFILQVAKSNSDLNDQIESLLGIYFSIIGPVLLISLFLALLLAHRIARQIHEVVHTLEKVKAGSIQERTKVDTKDGGLRDLALLFNKMMDQIEVLVDKNRSELDQFAHDVKTPMTRFKLIAERGLIETENPNVAREALESASEAADEIISMISALFDISLTESGSNPLHKTTFHFAEIVEEVLEFYEWVAKERDITLQPHLDPDLSVLGDRRHLKRVIANLVDNAVKYSPDRGIILLNLSLESKSVLFEISNQSTEIPEAELTQIWTRFFRGTHAKPNTGFGLGLSFVKAMVQQHSGQITVKSINSTTVFSLRLPVISDLRDSE